MRIVRDDGRVNKVKVFGEGAVSLCKYVSCSQSKEQQSVKKINRYSKTHLGNQPIRVLQYNIFSKFENVNKEFLELSLKTVIEKGLQKGIAYVISDEPICFNYDNHIQTPFVKIDNNKIHIHETFASYVWCISYSTIVIYDEAVAKPIQNLYYGDDRNFIDVFKIQKAEELFK